MAFSTNNRFFHSLTAKLLSSIVGKRHVAVMVMIGIFAFAGITRAEGPALTITVLYNNVPHATHLKTGWGFSCLI